MSGIASLSRILDPSEISSLSGFPVHSRIADSSGNPIHDLPKISNDFPESRDRDKIFSPILFLKFRVPAHAYLFPYVTHTTTVFFGMRRTKKREERGAKPRKQRNRSLDCLPRRTMSVSFATRYRTSATVKHCIIIYC